MVGGSELGAGIDSGAVALDQVGLTLKLEGQVIEGGRRGVPEDGDVVMGVPLLRKPRLRAPETSIALYG